MATTSHGHIKRFGLGRIVEHQLNALVFAVLVITGLSQRFHEYRLSHWIIKTLGGVDAMRIIHLRRRQEALAGLHDDQHERLPERH